MSIPYWVDGLPLRPQSTTEDTGAMGFWVDGLPIVTELSFSSIQFVLNDPSIIDDEGRRRHYYFHDLANDTIKIKALTGDFIKLDDLTSGSGGYIISLEDGASCHLAAVNDTTWVAVSYTRTWDVV